MTENASEAFPVILRASAYAGHNPIRREFLCRCLAPTLVQAGGWLSQPGCISFPIAQTKPASSRAIAVTATVSFLPRPDSAR